MVNRFGEKILNNYTMEGFGSTNCDRYETKTTTTTTSTTTTTTIIKPKVSTVVIT